MPAKQLEYSEDARRALKRGIDALAQAIVNEGFKNVTAGANPLLLKRGIERGVQAIVDNLKAMSTPVADQTKIAQVAAISAADEEIGKLIADVMDKVGKDGVITVE